MARLTAVRVTTRALAGAVALTCAAAALPAHGASAERVAVSDGTYADGQHRSVVAIVAVPKPGSWKQLDVICSGVLITERDVLTAAHCLEGYTTEQLLIAQPGSDLAKGAFAGVTSHAVHRSFARTADGSGIHDIAVLRTSQPLDGTPVKVAAKAASTSELTLVGYGSDESGRHPNLPRWAQLRDLSGDGRDYYPRYNSKWHLVAGHTGGRGKATACRGDSGGPLLSGSGRGATVVGIVGYGAKDCTSGWPALFTRTSTYARWIDTTRTLLTTRAKNAVLTYRARSGTSAVVQSRARGITLEHDGDASVPILIDLNADGIADYVAQGGRITQGKVPDQCRANLRDGANGAVWVWNRHCFPQSGNFLAFAVHGSSGIVTVGGVVLP